MPRERSRGLLNVLERAVDAHPHRIAFRFLEDGEVESGALSYLDLYRQALAVAQQISTVAKPGDRALLLFPPGLEFIPAFLGCLYAGVLAVPLYAPHPRRPDERLRSVVRDCTPVVALTSRSAEDRCRRAAAQDVNLGRIRIVVTDDGQAVSAWQAHRVQPHDIAFLQYTSGSTSEPMGVCVTHANLIANLRMTQVAMGLGPSTVCASWLPTHHDMGLIGDTWQLLYSGGTAVKMAPASFLQEPRRWLQAVGHYRATIMGAPAFAYDLCVRRIMPQDIERLDLSSLRVTYCGSEPIRHDALERFAKVFGPAGFNSRSLYPCYGLAEATLMATGGPTARTLSVAEVPAVVTDSRNSAPAVTNNKVMAVGCGLVVDGADLCVVDPDTLAPRDSGVGEIWIAGPHVCKGYWNKPEASLATFYAYTADGRGPFLRTGDLGFLINGEVFIAGRIKDVIILNGRNVYPQDLEHTVAAAHPLLAGGAGAAFAIDDGAGPQVVVLQEIGRQATATDVSEARKAAMAAIADTHQVVPKDVVIVRSGSVPRTTSGKVRRSAARGAYLDARSPRSVQLTASLNPGQVANAH